MNGQLLRLVILALATALAVPALSVGQSQGEAEIRSVATGLQETWNRHDMKAFANLLTEDADVVNVVGWWWRGRPQIEKKLTDAHAFMFRESTLTNDEVHIRFLTSQMAVVHVRWSLVGQKNPDGTPGKPRKGIMTLVMQEQAGKWLVAAFHNTDSVPEVPFPTGPAAAPAAKDARP